MELEHVCGQTPRAARGGGRSRRRGGPVARPAADRRAGLRRAADAAGCARGGGGRDHERAGAWLGRAAAARERAGVRGHARAGRYGRRGDRQSGLGRGAPATARQRSRPGGRGRHRADQPAPARAAQEPGRAGGETARACRSTHGSCARRPAEVDRGRGPGESSGRRAALSATPAGGADRCHDISEHQQPISSSSSCASRTSASTPANATDTIVQVRPSDRVQARGRDGRRADASRVRRRPAAGQDRDGLAGVEPLQRRRRDRCRSRASRGLGAEWRQRPSAGFAAPVRSGDCELKTAIRRHPRRAGGAVTLTTAAATSCSSR